MFKPQRKRDYILFLEDIISCVYKIEKYSKGKSFEEFNQDDMAVDAVIRNFEVIGEAVKNIPKDITEKYTDINWMAAARFRDILIHGYFTIDKEAVWDTIQKDIPALKKGIIRVLDLEKSKS